MGSLNFPSLEDFGDLSVQRPVIILKLFSNIHSDKNSFLEA
jgi:hypothetical protein